MPWLFMHEVHMVSWDQQKRVEKYACRIARYTWTKAPWFCDMSEYHDYM